MDSNLKFPAIKGVLGDWIYYQTIIPFDKVSDLIDNNHSIREYESLNDVLQRDLSKRAKKIKEYLIREETRFFNSAIIGVFGEAPNWYRFDFAPSAIPEMTLSEELLNSIGILELTGGEILFSIDGQHRIDGIKQALISDPERFQFDELPVIIIAHNDTAEGKIRTRRLFSEINTKAVRVSGLDDLITNEDNPIDINARRLYSDFTQFDNSTYIALNKTANIDSEASEFTTIINLKEVNRILYKNEYTHRDYRPSDEILDRLYSISENFWTTAIQQIPSYKTIFVSKTHSISDYRNSEGGNMLFRPIGIKILAEIFINYKLASDSSDGFWDSFNNLESDLNGEIWKDVLWNNAKGTIKKTSAKFLREYSKYLLNLEYDEIYVHVEYNKLKGIEREEDFIDLPEVT